MSGLSTFAEEILLDALLNLSPSYIALYTSDPTDGNTGTEVTGASYQRQPITLSRSGSDLSNTNAISFAETTESWGTITHCAILDAQSGGNQLINDALVSPKSVGVGETMTFPISSIQFNLD